MGTSLKEGKQQDKDPTFEECLRERGSASRQVESLCPVLWVTVMSSKHDSEHQPEEFP